MPSAWLGSDSIWVSTCGRKSPNLPKQEMDAQLIRPSRLVLPLVSSLGWHAYKLCDTETLCEYKSLEWSYYCYWPALSLYMLLCELALHLPITWDWWRHHRPNPFPMDAPHCHSRLSCKCVVCVYTYMRLCVSECDGSWVFMCVDACICAWVSVPSMVGWGACWFACGYLWWV